MAELFSDYDRAKRMRACLEALQVEMGEVIVMTAGREWDDVKDRSTNLTFAHILDWVEQVAAALE